MRTEHTIVVANSNNIKDLEDKSINLVVTSPPYPMIEMWDEMFCTQDSEIKKLLNLGDGLGAFYKMHELLNQVWSECDRVLADSGFICINIGDATRTIKDNFQLYSNHTQIINFFLKKGYSVLPDIHWRKQSNSPNKFMGSGMYPAGAYVTYEHEYILIFRKGGKRLFKNDKKYIRQKSAYFWEERNTWFSDLWDIKGKSQTLLSKNNKTRERNASFPIEIPYRLINMYSIKGDTVLDPFVGLGTTNLACMLSNRNSIGIELDRNIAQLAINNLKISTQELNKFIDKRIEKHLNFISSLSSEKEQSCYINELQNFKVKTKQELNLEIDYIFDTKIENNKVTCSYK